MNDLKITQFGDQILRDISEPVSSDEIDSDKLTSLIRSMRFLLKEKKLGIGLAAPQVGSNKSLAIIELQKTELRPDVEELSLLIINPKIVQTYGYRTQLWEGCISSGDGSANLFAKVPRYKKITLKYTDESGETHTKDFTGLVAHVLQHEIDHLNGVLFVDRVKDTKTYKTYREYKKMKDSTTSS